MRREPYPSDLADKAWAILEPLIPPAAPGGRPRKTDTRQVVGAIFYRGRNGCTRRAPPHDFPPWRTVYNGLEWWKWDGTRRRINDALRPRVRRRAGRQPAPSAGSIDSQAVKAAEVGGPHGLDGARLITGRKRHIVVDAMGPLLAVVATGASADDGAAAPLVLGELSQEVLPRLSLLWADAKYHNHALDRWVSENGWHVIQVKSRPPGKEGFVLLERRWVVERAFAWLGRCRIHGRGYERLPESSGAQVQISMIQLMLRRLTKAEYRDPSRYVRPPRKQAV